MHTRGTSNVDTSYSLPRLREQLNYERLQRLLRRESLSKRRGSSSSTVSTSSRSNEQDLLGNNNNTNKRASSSSSTSSTSPSSSIYKCAKLKHAKKVKQTVGGKGERKSVSLKKPKVVSSVASSSSSTSSTATAASTANNATTTAAAAAAAAGPAMTLRSSTRRFKRLRTAVYRSSSSSIKSKAAKVRKEDSSVDVSKHRKKKHALTSSSSSSSSSSTHKQQQKKQHQQQQQQQQQSLDPILLTQLSKQTYVFRRPNGTEVLYGLEPLVEWLLTTGDFTEPETRLPFSDKDLSAIDTAVKSAGLDKPSVLQAKQNPQRFADLKFRSDALTGLERCMGELVSDMMNIIEKADGEDGELRLLMTVFPLFTDLYKQLHAADPEYTRLCMDHFVTFLKGPPNRPTEDEMGFLVCILDFLLNLQAQPPSSPPPPPPPVATTRNDSAAISGGGGAPVAAPSDGGSAALTRR